MNSTSSSTSTKYDPDLLKSDVSHAKVRTYVSNKWITHVYDASSIDHTPNPYGTDNVPGMCRIKTVPCRTVPSICVWSTEYTQRVAVATFWRTFHHDGKISPAWWGGGGARPPHISLCLPSQAKLWCSVGTLQLRGQILYTLPISTPPLPITL